MKWLILFAVALVFNNVHNLYGQETGSQNVPEKSRPNGLNEKNSVVYYVKSGDTWYGIARKFGITYAELRMANKGTDDKLVPGREVYIPSEKLDPNDSYFKKKPIQPVPPVKAPDAKNIYHTVEKSQTLFSISKMYKVTVDEIKSWNNLKSNTISLGQKLIVGKKEDQSLNNIETTPPINKEESESPKTKTKPGSSGVEIVKSVSPEETERKTEDIVKQEEKPEQKPMEVNPSDMEVPEPLTDNREKIVFANGREEVTEMGIAQLMENEDHSITDKYYGLHRSAPVGTIIRVLNMSNSRKIYVKITGQLSEEDEKNGIVIKISKSCAETLGATTKNIKVNLLYGLSKD